MKKAYSPLLMTIWLSAAALFCAPSARALELETTTFTPRVWYLDWDFGEIDYGQTPMVMLNYVAEYRTWNMQVLFGYGTGWEADATDALIQVGIDPATVESTTSEADRLDLQWQIGKKISLEGLRETYNLPFDLGPLYVGAGYHYIEWDFDSPLGEGEAFYHGPELMVGFSQLIPSTRVYLRGSFTYLPIIWWTTNSPDVAGLDSGNTDGMLFDTGLVYQTTALEFPMHLSLGYRYMTVASDGAVFAEDTLQGAYAEVGIRW